MVMSMGASLSMAMLQICLPQYNSPIVRNRLGQRAHEDIRVRFSVTHWTDASSMDTRLLADAVTFLDQRFVGSDWTSDNRNEN